MSQKRARLMLSAYRMAGSVVYPFIGSYVAWRVGKGKEEGARRGERYGKSGVARPDGSLIWVHAASVGETLAVAPLIERLLSYGVKLVLTTGTVTSAQLAKDRFNGKLIHQYVPLDLKPAVSRFLDHWRPDLAIVAESEIWPVTIQELARRQIPQILVNGRLSDRSFARWTKRQHLAEALFEHFAHVIAQSDQDGERYAELGARPVSVSGNLKADAQLPLVDENVLAKLQSQIAGRPTWLAASTHDGEEQVAADVQLVLRKHHPGLLTIVVPRHPERAETIAAMMAAKGLKVVRRSSGIPISAETDVFLGDSLGEMGLYLGLTGICFVGKSLTSTGGHNPLEPAMAGVAVLSGPNVQNFREAYSKLVTAGAARLVPDDKSLAKAINHLLKNAPVRQAMMSAGIATVQEMSGTLDRTMKVLDPFIRPLIVKSRLKDLGRS